MKAGINKSLQVNMELIHTISGSLSYEKLTCILPNDWSIGNFVDYLIRAKLDNLESIRSITIYQEDTQ